MTIAAHIPVTMINVFSVAPEKQQELVDSLRQNTETVIKTLKGWIATSLIVSNDGARVVIHSQWETEADVAAMRTDPRMQAYFPKVATLASLESILGVTVTALQR